MGNLVNKYFNTNNKMYRFNAVVSDERSRSMEPGYLIAIEKWSNFKKEYLFDRYLSPQGYTELINEPDVKFDSLFEDLFDEKPRNENLAEILKENNVVILGEVYSDKYIRCRDKENADKLIKILRRRFIDITL